MGYRFNMATSKATPAGKTREKAITRTKAELRKRPTEDAPATKGTIELTEDQRASLDNAASNANLM